MLQCGMCEINITPPLGLCIPGYFEERRATGIKDDLYAKAVVFDNDKIKVVFIALDILCLDADVAAKIRKRVMERTGIEQKNIMVSATHSHTGAPILSRFSGEEEAASTEHMCRKAADAAIIAFNRRKPVKIGCGLGSEKDISFNRRYFMKDGSVATNPGIKNPQIDRPAGPIDPDVAVMRIDELDGTPMGVVTNFACHADVVGGTEYCADYPGQLSIALKSVLGPQCVSVFFTGASGNINHIDTTGRVEKSNDHYKKMGRILAGEVIKVREKVCFEENISLDIIQDTFIIPVRKPTQEEIEDAEKVMQTLGAGWLEKLFAGHILNFDYELAKQPVEVELQTVRIGSLGIVGLPGEIFTEFGLDIKGKSPFKYTMINTLANRNFGYITTREAIPQGGYEPRITRNLKLAPEAGYTMVSCSVEMLNKLFRT